MKKEYILGVIGLAFITVAFLISGRIDYEVARAEEEYAEANPYIEPDTIPEELERIEYETDCYEVRIAKAYNWGQTLVTKDGNVWAVQDPPEFYEGQLVSVMFDTKGTPRLDDDDIVDLWEFE